MHFIRQTFFKIDGPTWLVAAVLVWRLGAIDLVQRPAAVVDHHARGRLSRRLALFAAA